MRLEIKPRLMAQNSYLMAIFCLLARRAYKQKKPMTAFRDHGLLNDSVLFYYRLTLDPP